MSPFNLINQKEIIWFKSHLCRGSKQCEAEERSALKMKGIYLDKAHLHMNERGFGSHNPADHETVKHFGHAWVGWHVQRAPLTLALVTTYMIWKLRSHLTAAKQFIKSILITKIKDYQILCKFLFRENWRETFCFGISLKKETKIENTELKK